jgi:hypothetical protein
MILRESRGGATGRLRLLQQRLRRLAMCDHPAGASARRGPKLTLGLDGLWGHAVQVTKGAVRQAASHAAQRTDDLGCCVRARGDGLPVREAAGFCRSRAILLNNGRAGSIMHYPACAHATIRSCAPQSGALPHLPMPSIHQACAGHSHACQQAPTWKPNNAPHTLGPHTCVRHASGM